MYSLTRPGKLHYPPGQVTLPPWAGNVTRQGGSENYLIQSYKQNRKCAKNRPVHAG